MEWKKLSKKNKKHQRDALINYATALFGHAIYSQYVCCVPRCAVSFETIFLWFRFFFALKYASHVALTLNVLVQMVWIRCRSRGRYTRHIHIEQNRWEKNAREQRLRSIY